MDDYKEPGRVYGYDVMEHPVDSPENAYIIRVDLANYLDSLDILDRKILELYMEGWSGQEIASKSSISPSKVSRHLGNILAKVQEILGNVV